MKLFYCIVDFEATCWSSENHDNLGRPYEIIEFPSVLYRYDSETGKLVYVDQFQEYCQPVINQTLSSFCTELTGIEQKTVDGGKIFPEVMQRHYLWLIEKTDGKTSEVIFVTCGQWDFTKALKEELKRWTNNKSLSESNKKIYNLMMNPPKIYEYYVNIKTLFEKAYGTKAGGMVSMLNQLKIKLEGRHHSGLDDSKNIGKILEKVLEDKGDLDKFTIIQRVKYKSVV